MEDSSIQRKKIKRLSFTEITDIIDDLAIEEPLEIQLLYGSQLNPIQQIVSVTMRTPGNDEELAHGFLFTEGIIRDSGQVMETTVFKADNKVIVRLTENTTPFLQKTERNFYTTSSCGVCGKASIDAIKTVSIFTNQKDQYCLKPGLFHGLSATLEKQQALFKITGGLHASAIFDLNGNLLYLREDVGRHNALDKVIGVAFNLQELPLENHILLLSGRASFELIQKATMAGIKIIAAVGAPSSLAVQLAEESGITLLGFLRDKSFNIYTGEQRISLDAS